VTKRGSGGGGGWFWFCWYSIAIDTGVNLSQPGNGGAGLCSTITGSRVFYAGGGGGGSSASSLPGLGNVGGGADGSLIAGRRKWKWHNKLQVAVAVVVQ
jgi:hypothetical protein